MITGKNSGPSICLISRQRIIGKTNGSSAYVLSIAAYLKAKGYRIHYVSPSPATFGRWPFIRLLPEMDVFETVCIRGSVRLGRFLILLDPAVAWRAIIAVLDRFLARSGLSGHRFGRPAPYSIAVPLSQQDIDFLASQVPRLGDVLLLDYAFLTPCIALARADTPSIVIMHDLFSARGPQFQSLRQADSAAPLSEEEEMALLSAADLVVAIQGEEAAAVRKRLPHKDVVIAPMAVEPALLSSPGESDTVLFVGSNTAPNIDGLRWFVEEVWPLILGERPTSRLLVAGSVSWSYSRPAAGVEYHGIVPDLDGLYQRAGVVISPLRVGSGLKVKLVEALGWGKAIVASSVTLQGIGSLLDETITIADSPEDFASAVVAFLADPVRRKRHGDAALEVAKIHFGEEACYSQIHSFIADRTFAADRNGNSAAPWTTTAPKSAAAANIGSALDV